MLHHDPSPPPVETEHRSSLPLALAGGSVRLCACPGCTNLVTETWEETGRLCARCAIEEDLYDREGRRERAFGLTVS